MKPLSPPESTYPEQVLALYASIGQKYLTLEQISQKSLKLKDEIQTLTSQLETLIQSQPTEPSND